jgi:protein SCO1/2
MSPLRLPAALLACLALAACGEREPDTAGQPPIVELNDPIDEVPDLTPMSGDSGMLAQPVGELPEEYAFVDETGAERTFADLRGKFVVVDFIFTACAGPCPPMAEEMAKLQEKIRGRDDIVICSISVDPRNDTPEVLADYAESVSAESGTWGFARMPIGYVNELTREVFLIGDGGNPLAHSTKFLLLDKSGQARAHYDPLVDTAWLDKLLADLGKLQAETP